MTACTDSAAHGQVSSLLWDPTRSPAALQSEFIRGWCGLGLAVALSLCTTAHPLHSRCTNIFGASLSEMVMRPNPRYGPVAAPHVQQHLAGWDAALAGMNMTSNTCEVFQAMGFKVIFTLPCLFCMDNP